jgi:hypothetical protein
LAETRAQEDVLSTATDLARHGAANGRAWRRSSASACGAEIVGTSWLAFHRREIKNALWLGQGVGVLWLGRSGRAPQSSMGCGNSSQVSADGSTVTLVWDTHLCGGPKPLGCPPPPWLSRKDLQTIVKMGSPWGDNICVINCCGDPVCQNPWETGANEPLQKIREAYPQLQFTFKAVWVGFGDNARWEHMLIITQAQFAASTFSVQVPSGTMPGQVLQVMAPNGVMLQVTIPPGSAAGTTFQSLMPMAMAPTVLPAAARTATVAPVPLPQAVPVVSVQPGL